MATYSDAKCGSPTNKDGSCCCSYCEGWHDGHEACEAELARVRTRPYSSEGGAVARRLLEERNAERARADKAEARIKEAVDLIDSMDFDTQRGLVRAVLTKTAKNDGAAPNGES